MVEPRFIARWAKCLAFALWGMGATHAQGSNLDMNEAPSPLIWDILWETTDSIHGSENALPWKDWLEGAIVLKAPERWAGIPFRQIWSQWNGRWMKAWNEGSPLPTGSATPFDPISLKRSEALLQSRMVRKGFLDGQVSLDTVPHRANPNHLLLVVGLNPGKRRICRNATVHAEQSGLSANEVDRLTSEWKLWEGKPLDLDEADRMREGISSSLQERGWFGLTTGYIAIRVDTSGSHATGQVDMSLHIAPIVSENEETPHRRARIDSISFHWHPKRLEPLVNISENGIQWRVPKQRDMRGVQHRMHLKTGSGYVPSDLSKARQSLRQLPLIENVRVDIRPMERQPEESTTPLHVHFDTYPSDRRVLRVNGALTSRQQLGGELAFSLSDQDFRQRAEQLSLDFGFGLETVTPVDAVEDEGASETKPLNARTLHAGLTYNAGRLIPFGPDRFPKSNKPESLVSLTVRDEAQPLFSRTFVQWGIVERFVENPQNGSVIELRPLELAVTSSRLDPTFQYQLDTLGSDVVTSSFQSRALFSSGLTWRIGHKQNKHGGWSWGLRLEFEGAGNLFHGLDPRAPEETTVPLPSAFGAISDVQVARYTRWLFEGRGGWSWNGQSGCYGRFFAGVSASSIQGVAIPLEKQFYVGGPNSMRGWQALGLGPGLYGTSGLRVRGDIRMECNIEFRQYVNEWVQLACFMDAGNVWMTRPEESRPNVHFEWDTFLSQTALSTGAGIRLDFGYFLLRCDAGIPLLEPGGVKPTVRRWRIHPAVALPF